MPEQDPFQDTVAAEIAFLRGEIHILLDQHHDRDPHLFRLGRLLS